MAERTRVRLTEPVPPYGVPIAEAEGVVRVVANNPGPMTYRGTNTWLVEHGPANAIVVIDPGPDDPDHVDAILRAARGRIDRILISHAHADHSGAAPALAAALDLPLEGHRTLFDLVALPGRRRALADGDEVAGLQVVHTPGHAAEHLCFARKAGAILFTADHVMGWSTSVVPPPPWGSAGDYLRSLRGLQARDDRIFLSGHGPPIRHPQDLLATLLSQRARRQRDVATLLAAIGPATVDQLVARLYPTLKPGLDRAARGNILGFLHKLADEGRAIREGDRWSARAVVGPVDEARPVEEGPD